MAPAILEIEKPLKELEERIEALRSLNLSGKASLAKEIAALERKAEILKKEIYDNLSAWDRVSIARHPRRPSAFDYVTNVFDSFFELKGDRRFGDDPAVIAGFASLEGRSVAVIGHRKGRDTSENISRNFGMPSPEGFRKAQRVIKLAGKFGFPVLTLIDTPGAYPGMEAEARGQSQAIAESMAVFFENSTPIVVLIIGEGGSGGALAFGVGDKILMMENSVYSVISPEGCATILWHDAKLASKAAQALKLTSIDLKKMGLIDIIIPEPLGGVHHNPQMVYDNLKSELTLIFNKLCEFSSSELLKKRYAKFRNMGVYEEK